MSERRKRHSFKVESCVLVWGFQLQVRVGLDSDLRLDWPHWVQDGKYVYS